MFVNFCTTYPKYAVWNNEVVEIVKLGNFEDTLFILSQTYGTIQVYKKDINFNLFKEKP